MPLLMAVMTVSSVTDRWGQLRGRRFDIVVVGAGIHGATIAYEAARQGLDVALLDRCDFGSQTSANSLKIIHGGLRYLQHADIARMRESIVARRYLQRFAPHLVRPLKCIIPTYGFGLRGRLVSAVGMALNDLIAYDRNTGLPAENYLPRGKIISRRQCIKLLPGLEDSGLTGGAVWYDAIACDTERLTLEFVLRARALGACTINYMQADHMLTGSGNRITGLSVTDKLSGGSQDVLANCVVNATGPWLTELHRLDNISARNEHSGVLALNVITRKQLLYDCAAGIASKMPYRDSKAVVNKGHRLLFFVPWRGSTMIGTLYRRHDDTPSEFRVHEEDIEELLGEINSAYPAAELSRDDVTFLHAGLLPGAFSNSQESLNSQPRKGNRIYGSQDGGGIRGLYSVSGVKYTTACMLAQRVIKRLQGEGAVPSGKMERLEPKKLRIESGRTVGDGDRRSSEHQRLQERYGDSWEQVAALASKFPGKLAGSEVTAAEVVYSVREEMAQSLEDVMMRRTGAGSSRRPDHRLVAAVADLMSEELDWDAGCVKKEIRDLYTSYDARCIKSS